MSINPIRNNAVVPVNDVRQDRVVKNKLLRKFSEVKNTITELKKYKAGRENNIFSYRSLLKSLQSVSAKYGDKATVRLKNDHFKYGQASNFLKNMLHSSRYQTELEAAAKKINAEGSTVFSGMVIKTLQTKIDSALSEVDMYDKNISNLWAERNNIGKEIDNLVKIENSAKEAAEINHKARQNFSMIYQSNVGCKALNTEARHQFGNSPLMGKVSGNKVINEYSRVHGDEIFSHGNKELKSTIKAICDDLDELVKTGAEAWYTPTKKNMTTYRGQGMTLSGIETLISQFNADKSNKTETVYNLGQFFSTSRDVNIAKEFADLSQDVAKIIFNVKGNSSNRLSIPGGLSFLNDEGERLYSPLANFKVTHMSITPSNTYYVMLEEVTKADRTYILPY